MGCAGRSCPGWAGGWRLGTPDLVVRMPDAYEIPAGGPDLFRIFVLPIASDRVRYVKPHGALYNTAMIDYGQANAIVAAIEIYGAGLPVLGLPGSALARAAHERSVPFISEAFADRTYLPDGQLTPRTEPGAVITDPDAVEQQAWQLATSGAARSLCLHGDTPGAVDIARGVRTALKDAGINVAPFKKAV